MSTANTHTHGSGHSQGHQPHAHHFDSAEHQYSAAKFGTWTFLVTEILMFGALLVGYILYHEKYPEMYHAGSTFLDWRLGSLNTVVLLISSLTMALSIYYAQHNNKKMTLVNLYITLGCAGIFMIVKYFEYTHKIHLGLLPGNLFNPHGHGEEVERAVALLKQFPDLGQYFSFYFLSTGLHGSHVLIGMGLIVWLIIRTHRNEFHSKYYTPLECVGLFWHLVDLIWIYLFPLLYLVG